MMCMSVMGGGVCVCVGVGVDPIHKVGVCLGAVQQSGGVVRFGSECGWEWVWWSVCVLLLRWSH